MPSSCSVCGNTRFGEFATLNGYTYYRCRSCGLLVLEPLPTQTIIEQHYASRFESGNYQTLRTFSDQYRKIYEDYVSWMSRHVDLPGKRSLDVGCFTGEFVGALVDAGADAYGVELQDKAVSIAQRRLPNRVFQLDIDDAAGPFQEGSLDIVTVMAVIEHVKEPIALLKRVRKLLGDDAWLFIETPNASSWPATIAKRYWPLLAPVEHLHLFSETAIRRVLTFSGFELVELRPHIKWLPAAYVYDMLQYYGPEWRAAVGPLFRVLPRTLRERFHFPFFVGEMLVAAKTLPGWYSGPERQ